MSDRDDGLLSFREISVDAAETVVEDLGEWVFYTPIATGIQQAVWAIVDFAIAAFPPRFDSSVTATTTEVEFLYADIPDPKQGDLITLASGEEFTVDDIQEDGRDRITCRVIVKAVP